MISYKNLSNRSGVEAYAIGTDFIKIRFAGSSRVYTYSDRITGLRHVEHMKILAEKGKGLGTYISKHVKDLFE